MDRILKVIDFIIYALIVASIIAFIYGSYQLIDLFILRG
jgi:TRAP-type C4-dicarboxylate transport system permease small subunit